MNKDLFPALLLAFVNVLGFSLLIPVLPFIVEQYGLSQIWYGILLSSYAGALFFGAPILGALSDVFGRKPLLIISQVGTLFSWVLFAIAYFLPADIILFALPLPVIVILLSRLLDGVTGGNNSVVQAFVSDVTKPKDRARAFGLIGATFGVGFMIGPVLGGLTSQTSIGYLGTVLFAAILSLITLVCLFYFLPERNVHRRGGDWKVYVLKRLNVFQTIWAYRTRPIIGSALAVKFLVILAFASFTSILSLYLIDRFGLSSLGIGLFLFVIGLYAVFNQTVLVGWIVDRLGSGKTIVLGSILVAVGLIIYMFIPALALLILLSYIFSLGTNIIMPTVKSVLANASKDTEQGEVLGADEALQSLAQATMPVLSASLYVLFGPVVFVGYGIFILLTATPLAIRVARKS